MLVSWIITARLPPLIKNHQNYLKFTSIGIMTIVLLLSVRTVLRNHVWKDNFTLFTSDVLVSENSIKCNVAAGGEWMKKADTETDSVKKDRMYKSAFTYLEKAIQLYPKATNGYILYGNAFATYRKEPKMAIDQYLKVLAYDPYETNAYGNTVKVLNSIDNAKETDYKISVYNKLLIIQSDNSEVNYHLGKLYGQYKNNLDSSAFLLERSINLDPGNVSAYKDLGIVYSLQGNFQKALTTLYMAQKLAPDDQFIRQNILTTTKIMKVSEKKKL
jgi:tetratricopeptide (TPR) repeat protein